MVRTISTDHCPSLFFKDWDGAVEAARKLDIQYMEICLIELNGEEIGYGLFNPFREELVDKDFFERFRRKKGTIE